MSASPGDEEVIEDEPVAPVMASPPRRAPAQELDLEGPDAELLRTAMASIDSDEVVDEASKETLPELGEEPLYEPAATPTRRASPATLIEAPSRPFDRPAPGPSGSPARRAAPGPVDLTDELEEAEFFAQQGLLADARDALLQLRTIHAGHPALEARLNDVDRRLAARAASPPASPATASRPASAPGHVTRQSPSQIDASASDGASFDLGADLAEELDRAPDLGAVDEEFQYSVEDVFNQFKRGVAETVTAEDSDTHYDLGIAYKEMGLVDDAVNEFETALRGNNRKKEIDSLAMIALCRISQGRPGDAIEPLRRALRSDHLTKESSKAVHYELGLALEAMGEREQALWCFQKVARADPTYRETASRVAGLGGGPGRPPPGLATATATARPVGGPVRSAVVPAGAPQPVSHASASSQPPSPPPPGRKKNIGFL
jgi:tetratricopeptide (TPR) repeat protein